MLHTCTMDLRLYIVMVIVALKEVFIGGVLILTLLLDFALNFISGVPKLVWFFTTTFQELADILGLGITFSELDPLQIGSISLDLSQFGDYNVLLFCCGFGLILLLLLKLVCFILDAIPIV